MKHAFDETPYVETTVFTAFDVNAFDVNAFDVRDSMKPPDTEIFN